MLRFTPMPFGEVAMRHRCGLSIIEIVVVIATIGLLLAILIPAIQYAREASRQVQCSSHIRQLVLATHLYESAHKRLPPGQCPASGSLFCAILPYIERGELFDRIDTTKSVSDRWKEANDTIIPLYYCPSDGAPARLQVGDERLCGTNYAGNVGTWYTSNHFDGPFRYATNSQAKGAGEPFSLGEMSRGTSHIAGLSESLRADLSSGRKRVLWNYPQSFSAEEIDEFCKSCSHLPSSPASSGYGGNRFNRGTPWTSPTVMITLYNHVVGPNQPSCIDGASLISGAASASSNHPATVNVAFLDGHVTKVGQGIDLSVWRGFAKRSLP